ncbi:hypothetical protein [Rhizobium tumorigenes]|uniref:Uncharacterized protein n=1 Tax=Rhizobium tumorigenes TaxID=2041385 RepID=A0AAF1KG62_9HYPH|nr:hypothetical protein [Rhizobium tumorigenes]WFR96876.1 hypothetical protein PR017_07115 [Rhizobium tumorigenes]
MTSPAYADVIQALRLLNLVEAECPPGVGALLLRAKHLLERDPTVVSVRAVQRGELIRYLANRLYRPGMSDRRIAAEMMAISIKINVDNEYFSEPKHTLKKIIVENGGKMPSDKTIRRDLRS